MTTASEHPDLYSRLGINLSRLGCIMLDTEPIDLGDAIAPEDYYRSDRHDRSFINGPVAETGAHITLLYGLLTFMWSTRGAYIADVDEVLDGWTPPDQVLIGRPRAFQSDFAEEPYSCIYAPVMADALEDAHDRLALLPHMNTHTVYRPHLTLAYVRRFAEARVLASLSEQHYRLRSDEEARVKVTGLNYGSSRVWDRAEVTA
jgi:hypothetical protein